MNKARIAMVFIGACAVLLSACAPSATTTTALQSAGIAVATKAANTTDPGRHGQVKYVRRHRGIR